MDLLKCFRVTFAFLSYICDPWRKQPEEEEEEVLNLHLAFSLIPLILVQVTGVEDAANRLR